MIAVSGGLVGLAVSRPAAIALTSLISQGTPLKLDLRIDSKMLLFVAGLSVFAALVSGVAPALRATREALAPGLQQASRSTTAAPLRRVAGTAVVSLQFALSLMLIAAAFLFVFSLYKLTHFDTGLSRHHLVMADVDARESGYRGADLARLHRRIQDRLAGSPGVELASFSRNGIYSGRNSNNQVGADGFQAPNGPQRNAFYDEVGPRYFATIGARLIAGRDFDERDNAAAPPVALINEEFARHFFSGKNPIGLNIYPVNAKKTYQVVGVVANIRSNVRQAPPRYFYLPGLQTASDFSTTRFLARTGPDPGKMIGDLRAAIRAEGAALRIEMIASADELLNRTLDLDRLIAALSMGFGVLALMLAAIGVYGRLAYEVTQRKGEIGIRMALGASRSNVMKLVLWEVAIVAFVGIAAGTVAALWVGKLAASLVFEVEPVDPRVLSAAAILLGATALCAAVLPARRAALIDPMAALRNE